MKLAYAFQGDQMGNNEQEMHEKINTKCNQLRDDRKNELLNNINLFYIKEYVYYDETFVDSKVLDMLKHTEITKLANLFL